MGCLRLYEEKFKLNFNFSNNYSSFDRAIIMYVLINKNWGKIVETYLMDGRANVIFENGIHRILHIRRQNSEHLLRDNHSCMFKYSVDFNVQNILPNRNENESEDEVQFEVQTILRHKKKGYSYVYEIKWKGYEATTWEPELNLYCTELLLSYNLKHNIN